MENSFGPHWDKNFCMSLGIILSSKCVNPYIEGTPLLMVGLWVGIGSCVLMGDEQKGPAPQLSFLAKDRWGCRAEKAGFARNR